MTSAAVIAFGKSFKTAANVSHSTAWNQAHSTLATACLLVGEDQKHRITHLVFVQHLVQLLARILNAISVVAVNDIDQAVRALVVVAPQRANLVLATHIPNREGQVLVPQHAISNTQRLSAANGSMSPCCCTPGCSTVSTLNPILSRRAQTSCRLDLGQDWTLQHDIP